MQPARVAGTDPESALRVDRQAADLGKLDRGNWELASRRPDPRLSGWVSEYQGYSERAPRPVRRRQLASTDVGLILNLGAPFRMIDPLDGSSLAVRGSFVAGLHDGYSIVDSAGEAFCLQINFTPLGAYRCFGVPMYALSEATTEISDLFGAAADRLLAQLHAAQGWQARFDLLDTFFTPRFAAGPQPSSAAVWAWRELERSAGTARAGELARELGCSRKHLGQQFRQYVGLPAKTVARMFRFQRCCDLIGRDASESLAAIASASGYADQAHMHRDFLQFSGWSPGRYRRQTRTPGTGIVESTAP